MVPHVLVLVEGVYHRVELEGDAVARAELPHSEEVLDVLRAPFVGPADTLVRRLHK